MVNMLLQGLADLQLGSVVKATVTKVEEGGGLIVALTANLSAFVPPAHTSDLSLKRTKKPKHKVNC